jgi:hypothetical protein
MSEQKTLSYPNIYCAGHDKVGPGYIMCDHVKKLEDVSLIECATATTMGTIACAICAEKGDDTQYIHEHFVCVCEDSLFEKGILFLTGGIN